MEVNRKKSIVYAHALDDHLTPQLVNLVPFSLNLLDEGVKYLGFMVKNNKYKKMD